MKKIWFILAVMVALALTGCATGGGGAASGDDLPPFSVDLSTLPFVRNTDPIPAQWGDFFIPLPPIPVDVTQYSRITIRAKYFDAGGAEITQGDGNIMVVVIYDPEGDWRGPELGPGPNTPLKEFNVGGFSGHVSSDRGVRTRLARAPGGLLFQTSNSDVKFIELTEFVFHNRTASGN
jgi:hypothetical protein